jgi:hypothetical protein
MIDPETKVREILKRKKGSLKRASLPPGTPSWDELAELTWAEIEAGAQHRLPGFKTVRKLLTDQEYDR